MARRMKTTWKPTSSDGKRQILPPAFSSHFRRLGLGFYAICLAFSWDWWGLFPPTSVLLLLFFLHQLGCILVRCFLPKRDPAFQLFPQGTGWRILGDSEERCF